MLTPTQSRMTIHYDMQHNDTQYLSLDIPLLPYPIADGIPYMRPAAFLSCCPRRQDKINHQTEYPHGGDYNPATKHSRRLNGNYVFPMPDCLMSQWFLLFPRA
jgi:hypothetical protein